MVQLAEDLGGLARAEEVRGVDEGALGGEVMRGEVRGREALAGVPPAIVAEAVAGDADGRIGDDDAPDVRGAAPMAEREVRVRESLQGRRASRSRLRPWPRRSGDG
jgi:hypothetical protein